MREEKLLNALQLANRHAPDAAVERRLVQLRAEIFRKKSQTIPRQVAANRRPDGRCGLPATSAAELDVAVLRQALATYGALHVRRLVDPGRAEFMRWIVDRALEAQEAACGGATVQETLPWFEVSRLVNGGALARAFLGREGLFAVDSPRGLFHLLETFYTLKLDHLITAFFGERPALSGEKTVLRRATPVPSEGGWHQDGRFLGTAIRSLNVWVALSDCGVDAPGLELVPKRLYRIIETGTENAEFDWVASNAMVEREFPGLCIRPEFKAGDALLFDHFLLHRTSAVEGMTAPRYAIESWFFAPSAYPETQTGLYV